MLPATAASLPRGLGLLLRLEGSDPSACPESAKPDDSDELEAMPQPASSSEDKPGYNHAIHRQLSRRWALRVGAEDDADPLTGR